MSVPGLVVLLTILIALERFGLWVNRVSWLPWRRHRTGMPVSAAAFDMFDTVFTTLRKALHHSASTWTTAR